jgi:hypothetical protein
MTIALIILSLAAQTSVTGRINGSVYTDRGQTVSGAIVIISTEDGRMQRTARTNAQGGFTFSGLPVGSYALQGCSEEFGPSAAATVELKAGTDAKQDLKTEPGYVRTVEPICTMEQQTRRETNQYNGDTLSIDFKGDIKDFFQRVASVSSLQLDVDPSISRNVTLHLKDVPWDLAVDVVLANSGLSGESNGKSLRVTASNPLLGQNRLLLGTVTIEGKVAEFNLENPRTVIQINAPNTDGAMQNWPVEWLSANDMREMGVKPDTFRVGDQVFVTGNLTRRNSIDAVIIRRLSDGFSWGGSNAVSSAPSDGVMFVSSTER